MEQKAFQFKLKSEPDETGRFEGWASVYGNVDHGGDICAPGCFSQTLKMRPQVPILWQHRPDEPIGIGNMSDSHKGLQIDGRLILSDATAKKAYEFMKANVLRGLSIGYETVKSTNTPDGGRLLQELRLHEVSVVTFPMNEQATVTSVKSLSDVSRLLKSMPVEELDAGALQTLAQIDRELKRLRAHSPEQDDAVLHELKALAGELARLAA
jgi:HK97 family phage prohead protease